LRELNLLSNEEKEVIHRNTQARIQADEAINIFECEFATLSKLQLVKMNEIKSLEDYKIESSKQLRDDKLV